MGWGVILHQCAKWLKRCVPAGIRLVVLRWLGRVPYPEVSLSALTTWAGKQGLTFPGSGLRIYPELDARARRQLEAPEFTADDEVITRLAPGSGPRLSVVVVTYNNLPLTRLCLRSVALNTSGCELIVVDNASSDHTRQWLQELAGRGQGVKILLNQQNQGFAKANNQGLEIATSQFLVLLNNDTMVPAGWFQALEPFLQDPGVGLVGPCTNRVANQARVGVPYRTDHQMQAYAAWRAREFSGQSEDIPMLAMFCLGMRRDAYEQVGPLDERFGIGMFEDDDYCRRARDLGLRVVLARGAFVHHFQMAAFGKLRATGEYQELFNRNQRLFEAKWRKDGDL